MPSALVLYHFLYPDDVVSSLHVSELCYGLAERGWDVTAAPCNRGCRDESRTYRSVVWKGVHFRRIWRPRFKQASSVGRILNSLWMISRWNLLAFTMRRKPDVVIIGTDPVLSVVAAIAWKRVRGVRVVHWCFDLYPEAAVAHGLLAENGRAIRWMRRLLALAYRCCDAIVDVGSCMRFRLDRYAGRAKRATILPWALAEPVAPLPVDSAERTTLFGDAKLALLYSGNFGLAHECKNTLVLARKLRANGVKLIFSARGNGLDELRAQIGPDDSNIGFVPFASESQREARLASADVHVVSLRKSWTGVVVPSKFFGALAAGRPVLFEGSEDSAIARWIREHRVGWVLGDVERVAAELLALADSPGETDELRLRCHRVYQENFSRSRAIDQFDTLLRALR